MGLENIIRVSGWVLWSFDTVGKWTFLLIITYPTKELDKWISFEIT